jgi:hypothetical protein
MEAYAYRIFTADTGSLDVVVAQLFFYDSERAQVLLYANESVEAL